MGSTAITPIEKAEVIADSLQEQFEPNHVVEREDFDQRMHAEVENFLATPQAQEIEPTTPTEVLTYVQRIKPQKSPDLHRKHGIYKEREEPKKSIKKNSIVIGRSRSLSYATQMAFRLVEDIQLSSALSLAMGESCDIKVTVQVALSVRYMSSQGPKEELQGRLPLSGQTRGEDISNAVQKCLEDNKINLNETVSIATDGEV
ncbi:protein ZBED8 [Trichonephila clavipes]|nr:protein ZBED8 [Trichonephila clavipes]